MLSISLPHLCEGASQCNAGTTQTKKSVCLCTAVNLACNDNEFCWIGTWPHKTSWASNTASGTAGVARTSRKREGWQRGMVVEERMSTLLRTVKYSPFWCLVNTYIRAVASCFVSIFKWCNHWGPRVVLVTIGSVAWETAMAPELCKLT